MIFDNARYLSLLIKKVYWLLILTLIIVSCLAVFFAKKWYQAPKLDNVYILSSDNTLLAARSDGSMARPSVE